MDGHIVRDEVDELCGSGTRFRLAPLWISRIFFHLGFMPTSSICCIRPGIDDHIALWLRPFVDLSLFVSENCVHL